MPGPDEPRDSQRWVAQHALAITAVYALLALASVALGVSLWRSSDTWWAVAMSVPFLLLVFQILSTREIRRFVLAYDSRRVGRRRS